MAGGSGRGIADDADAYASLDPPDGPARGIADDADAFAELAEEGEAAGERRLDSRWLYRLEGAVFGPVSAKELLELLYAGELDEGSEVAPEDGEFLPLARFGAFRPHVKRAAADRRVREEAAARHAREARIRRARRLRWAGAAALAALVGSGAVYGVVRWRRGVAAEEEKARREAALEAELAALLEGVSIEPPLRPLVRGEPDSAEKKGRARPRRAASRTRRSKQTGTLTDQEVVGGVQRAFSGLVGCIKAQLRRDPASVPETIVLRFGIGNAGRVQAVTFDDRFLRRSKMRACFEARLGRVRWRAYDGEVRNVEYPIRVRRPS